MLAALILPLAMPATASNPAEAERLSTYLAARAADTMGDPATASKLFAALVRDLPADERLRQRAIVGAIEAGDMRLALELGNGVPFDRAPLELRMLTIADLLVRNRQSDALAHLRNGGGTIDSSFLLPFVEAWARADAKDGNAVQSLDSVNPQSALARQVNEHRALIHLKLRQPADALPLAEKALEEAGGRADRLRLAFADGFRAAGDMATAAKMVDAKGAAMSSAQARLRSGKPLGEAIDSSSKAFGELLLGLAIALNRLDDKSIAVSLAQVARHANPENDAAVLLLGLLLDEAGRSDDAVAALRTIDEGSSFANQAEDAEVRILLDNGREKEALARAHRTASIAPSADAFSRLGAVFSRLERQPESAQAYAQAIALAQSRETSDELWALQLYRASALEESGNWPEAKAIMQSALASSPENSLLLNFLGYGMLERGEDIEAAEAMVRKASALKPDDASITDSLGWAQFKRGKVDEAIETLNRAAASDPGQGEIREHLGDALYTAGRRIEARFAWRAALATTEEAAAKARIESKIERGLDKANAAP
ncbi:tetratricopeptide repeat protein [Sphingomonas sp. HDW15A]|uniref:tetratricopeptide repeat protein n=1 Tax=Sphingomonas sp. HDW15A TaxID=2714942 RepID=UPI00140E79B5|nr:tetratricopeptide repeat protein [Sphingomonas sp. HDW15A]QIK96093.1 tetratricopeptide repeat protein [Sphingomonas sp. HDW15A]